MPEKYSLFEPNKVDAWHNARDAEFIVCYIKDGHDALRISSTKYPLPIPHVGDYIHNDDTLLGQVYIVEHNVFIYNYVFTHETTVYLRDADSPDRETE